MSITTVLESADDQCRMSVTRGSTPASSALTGEASPESSVTVSAAGTGALATGSAGAVAGCGECGVDAVMVPASAFAERARWPRVHQTLAPKAIANNTTTATTARPGREWSSSARSARACSAGATGWSFDFEASAATNSEFSTRFLSQIFFGLRDSGLQLKSAGDSGSNFATSLPAEELSLWTEKPFSSEVRGLIFSAACSGSAA